MSNQPNRKAQPLYPPIAPAVASGCIAAWRGHSHGYGTDHNVFLFSF